MVKKNSMLLPSLILVLLVSAAAAKTPSALTLQDCWSVFPVANAFEAARAIEPGVLCAKVWQGDPNEQIPAYVFQRSLPYEGSAIEILVGMTMTGVISNVRVKDHPEVEEEFLSQFRAKTSLEQFEVARTAEDLLYVPAKIKAMKQNLALSESIVQGVKEIAVSANKMLQLEAVSR